MTDEFEKAIRQCWAFHYEGFRCEHPAGHPGDHIVTKTWTDLQCATPGEFEIPKGQPELSMTDTSRPVDMPMPEFTPAPTPKGCIACNHNHKSGECKCGCYEHIG